MAKSGRRFLAGIDHAFGFPIPYVERYGIKDWDHFLDDFCTHWPTGVWLTLPQTKNKR